MRLETGTSKCPLGASTLEWARTGGLTRERDCVIA